MIMGKFPRFAIVIPTAFRVRRREIERRALALVQSRCFEGQEIVVSHGTLGDDTGFCRELEKAGAHVTSTRLGSAEVPLGLLRNRGAELATAEYLLFWDVDLAPPADFVNTLASWLKQSASGFAIVPCLYASAAGTRRFTRGATFDPNIALDAFYQHRRELLLHVALNTSTLAITRNRFFDLGGFDERYLDHGLEDLDFLLRLALTDEQLPIPTDLFTDERHQSPAFSTGFRSVLNLLSLPLLLSSVVSLHRWHRRPKFGGYYQRRGENWQLFQQNIRNALNGRALGSIGAEWKDVTRSDGTLDSVLVVHRLLSRCGSGPSDPSALFDEVPQFYFHPDRFRRRLLRSLLGVLGHKKGPSRVAHDDF